MKIENLLFSLIVVFVAAVVLSIAGWGVSFLIGINITPTEGFADVAFNVFMVRVLIGLAIIGMASGVLKILDLFVFCMSYDKDKK